MYNPIIDNENISLKNLIIFLKMIFSKVVKLPLFAVLLIILYFTFFKTPSYSAKVSFYTDYKKASESSLFTPFIGVISGNESLNFSIDNYISSDKFLEEISLQKYNVKKPVYKAVGCSECENTGFKGRLSIGEFILMDEKISKLIYRSSSENEISEYVFANNKKLFENGILTLEEGKTSLSELLRITEE